MYITGNLVRHYQIRENLSESLGIADEKHAVVYLADDLKNKRDVVLKSLPLSNPYFRNLIGELKVLEGFQHPNIISVDGYFVQRDGDNITANLVLEKLDCDLEDVLDEDVDRSRILPYVMWDVSSALHYVHSLGYAHLDVKPTNIGVRRCDCVLIDFGSCLHKDDFEVHRDLIFATPEFSAPELLDDGVASFSADMYSLGMVLNEMLNLSSFRNLGPAERKFYLKLRRVLVNGNPEKRLSAEDVLRRLKGFY